MGKLRRPKFWRGENESEEVAEFRHDFRNKELADIAYIARELGAKMYPGGWCQLLNWGGPPDQPTAAATAFNNFSSLSVVTPTGNVNPTNFIAANTLKPGTVLVNRYSGVYSTTGTPNITLALGFGGASVVLATTAATTTGSGVSNLSIIFEAWTTVTSQGSSGGSITAGYALGLPATATTPTLAPAVTTASVAINTTAASFTAPLVNWSAASASNTVTIQQFACMQMN
jgi:hypothetical protein